LAGLAAAFALGNGSSDAAATADVAGHQSAAAAALPRTAASAAQPVTITQQSATGMPVARVDASRLTAITPNGKHHRTLPAKYVVQSGDTLASIAKHLYSRADYWPVLYWANHAKIQYANEIHQGLALTVPAKPAKIPGAPAALAPSAPATSTGSSAGSSGGGYSSVSAAPAARAQAAPAQTTSAGGSGSFQACVIARESGGNPQVMNSTGHYGLYQFSAATWAAYGGNPADFGHASVAEQNQVFDNAMAAGGESNWAPYDGC
jgi:hypothetical protein